MDQYRLKKYISENPDAKLRDLVTKLLYDDIVELRITPGSKLNVNQIAASLGISRTPVAEAIGKLLRESGERRRATRRRSAPTRRTMPPCAS